MTSPPESHVQNSPLIALIGDYSPDVPAHQAIPRALELASIATGRSVGWRWIHTSDIPHATRDPEWCDAVWVVPASPNANMRGVLGVIREARETGRPFLGTCGGFQHALIEFARSVAGLADADHAESNPRADTMVVQPLSCSLSGKSDAINFVAGNRLGGAYGRKRAVEAYHCNFGFNAGYRLQLEHAGLRFTGFDDSGEVRAMELPSHPFFIGTLYQPERAALRGEAHPLIRAFVRACCSEVRSVAGLAEVDHEGHGDP